MNNPSVPISTLPIPNSDTRFEHLYIASRNLENRIYSDEQVERLPAIEKSHIRYSEWQIRKRSCEKLIRYLEEKTGTLKVLEVGCGNGWLSRRIAELGKTRVIGIDINETEISQAKRVFKNTENLEFIAADIQAIDRSRKFDIIIFAASIQYFPDLDDLFEHCFPRLKEAGEIHILDTFFYERWYIEQARMRSLNYYRSIGYGEMAHFYFHHGFDSLIKYKPVYLYHPGERRSKLFERKIPFPWICINKQ